MAKYNFEFDSLSAFCMAARAVKQIRNKKDLEVLRYLKSESIDYTRIDSLWTTVSFAFTQLTGDQAQRINEIQSAFNAEMDSLFSNISEYVDTTHSLAHNWEVELAPEL